MNVLNRLALGTVQFGLDYGVNNYCGKPPISVIKATLNLASERGIDFLDTANAYGDAEQIIGVLNAGRFNLVTKILPESQSGLFELQLQNSLKQLKVESVYGLLAHRPMDVVNNPGIWDKMKHQKEKLRVNKIGFSFDCPEEYFAVLKKSFYPDIVQVPLNYFDNRFVRIIEELKCHGCEIHVRSAFLQGLFFADITKLPSFFDEVRDLIVDLQEQYDSSLAAALLRFAIEHEHVDKVVVGVQNQFQLQNILKHIVDAPVLGSLTIKISNNILRPSLWPK